MSTDEFLYAVTTVVEELGYNGGRAFLSYTPKWWTLDLEGPTTKLANLYYSRMRALGAEASPDHDYTATEYIKGYNRRRYYRTR